LKGKDLDYKKNPQLAIEIVKVMPLGKPPAPRCLHSACAFGKQFVAFFGGKNDNYFRDLSNYILNDLFMYDIGKISC